MVLCDQKYTKNAFQIFVICNVFMVQHQVVSIECASCRKELRAIIYTATVVENDFECVFGSNVCELGMGGGGLDTAIVAVSRTTPTL